MKTNTDWKRRKSRFKTKQEPLDLSYTSEGLNAQKEEDPIQAPDPLKDVFSK